MKKHTRKEKAENKKLDEEDAAAESG